jgi:hypothetical protein
VTQCKLADGSGELSYQPRGLALRAAAIVRANSPM